MRHLICSIDGCDRPHEARALCRTHYDRLRKHGDPMAHIPVRDQRQRRCNQCRIDYYGEHSHIELTATQVRFCYKVCGLPVDKMLSFRLRFPV